MDLIQSLKERLTSRQSSTVELYWGTLRKAATKPSDKLLDEVEGLAVALSKSPEQVEEDLSLLGELTRAEQALAVARQEAGRVAELRAQIATDSQAAEAAAKVVEEAGARARDARLTLNMLSGRLHTAESEVARCRVLLERAGAPSAK